MSFQLPSMFFVVFLSLNPYRKVGPDLIIHGVITPYKWSKINEIYLGLFHPEINEVTTSAPTELPSGCPTPSPHENYG